MRSAHHIELLVLDYKSGHTTKLLYNVQWHSQRPSTIDEGQREDITLPRMGADPPAIDFLQWGGNRAGGYGRGDWYEWVPQKYVSRAGALPASRSITESWPSEEDLRTFGSKTKPRQCSSRSPNHSGITEGRTTHRLLMSRTKSIVRRQVGSQGLQASLERRVNRSVRQA